MHRQMRYYIAVIETGISQSAVSQQIKALENELRVTLIERHGRKLTVTPAWRYFSEQAKKQAQAPDRTVREVCRIDSGEYQRLRVGVLNGFSTRIIQKAMLDCTHSHPSVLLSLTAGTHEELFHPVNEGSLDMAVNDRWRALSGQYIHEKLMEQKAVRPDSAGRSTDREGTRYDE